MKKPVKQKRRLPNLNWKQLKNRNVAYVGIKVLETENTGIIYNEDMTSYVYITPKSVRLWSECE